MLQNFSENVCWLSLMQFISCLQIVAFAIFFNHQTAVVALDAFNVRMRVLDIIYPFLFLGKTLLPFEQSFMIFGRHANISLAKAKYGIKMHQTLAKIGCKHINYPNERPQILLHFLLIYG